MDKETHAHVLLLVETDADMREALTVLLRLAGFAVSGASSVAEAMAILEAGLRPCVVLLDPELPNRSADEFHHRRINDETFATLPVLLISDARDTRADETRLGARATVPKSGDFARVPPAIDLACGANASH
jgi:two-component system, OmpR family, response regulator